MLEGLALHKHLPNIKDSSERLAVACPYTCMHTQTWF